MPTAPPVIDPFTMEARLCDDAGMVSHAPVVPPNVFDATLTYLRQHNNLRAQTYEPPYLGEPFPCTGHAHLAGQHIRCTSPAHHRAIAGLGVALSREAEEFGAPLVSRPASLKAPPRAAPEGAPGLPYVLVQSPGGWTAHLPGDPASWECALSPEAAVGKLVQRYPEAFGARPAPLPAAPEGAERLAAIRERVTTVAGGGYNRDADELARTYADDGAFLLLLIGVQEFALRAADTELANLDALRTRAEAAEQGFADLEEEARAWETDIRAALGVPTMPREEVAAHIGDIRKALVHPDGDQNIDLAYAAEQTARQLADEIERLGQKQAEVDALDARVTALNGELVAAREEIGGMRAALTPFAARASGYIAAVPDAYEVAAGYFSRPPITVGHLRAAVRALAGARS